VESARESEDAKVRELARLKEAETRQAVDGVTVESVVRNISSISPDVTRALSDISAKLTAEVELLESVRQAVALETRELERLHNIDVAAPALDQLVRDYARRKEELEEEISARRTEWEEEARTAERERKEQEEALKKQRQREIEDYEYKKALERKKAQDKYEEELRAQEKANRERQEQLERSWQEREAALKEREDELARLRQQAAEFPERLRQETERAAAQATSVAEARVQQEILLMKKDAEAERRVAELQIKALEATVARQGEQIAVLEKQLAEAKQQVQDSTGRGAEPMARQISPSRRLKAHRERKRSPT
jgi:chromosome segregation ATPase